MKRKVRRSAFSASVKNGMAAIRADGPIRNGIVLTAASCLTVLFGLVASKFWAIAVGPTGMGHASAFQSLVTFASTVLSLGLGNAVIKEGAEQAAIPGNSTFRVMVCAAWSLWRWSCVAGAVCILVCGVVYRGLRHEPAGIPSSDFYLFWALTATTASSIALGVISAARRIDFQATCLALGALIGHCISVPLVWWGGPSVIDLALALNCSGTLIVCMFLYRIIAAQHPCPVELVDFARVRKELFQTGMPLALGSFVAGGVQSLVPLLVIYQAGYDAAGLLRAASMLAFQSVNFLLTAITQDFFPRLSAVRNDTGEVLKILRQQFILTLVVAILVTTSLTALGPLMLQLCFSEEFVRATVLLDALAVGTMLKMGSWCMAYVILARCSSRLFLFTQSVTGLLWVVSSVVLIEFCGPDGVGYGFVLTYLVYSIFVAAIVSRELRSNLPWKMLISTVLATLPILGVIGARILLATP